LHASNHVFLRSDAARSAAVSARRTPSTGAASTSALATFLQAYLHPLVDEMSGLVKEHGLSMPQFATLQHLHAWAPRSVSAIAAHLNLSLASTSHLVDRLVGKGLLVREEDPDDRRQKRVDLAPAGRALVAETHARSAGVLDALLREVAPAKRAELERVLADVVADLPAARGGATTSPEHETET
jgi:DNA-binding MarR family transcriptional regulator